MSRLLVIGFDGMDYFMTRRTIGQYRFENVMPVLRRQLTKEDVTGPSWASFYTGLDKGVHGVTDGWGRRIGDSNSFADIQHHTFWNIVRKAGYKVYIDNLPITPDGFPFASDKKRDLVNLVYKPLEGGMSSWRDTIRGMGFKKVLQRITSDSFELIEGIELLRNKDLIFIQFSFIDRIGHVFTFRDNNIMMKSYTLAYSLIDRLYEMINPKYLIVTADHGFWKNNTKHRLAKSAVAILNNESYQLFFDNHYFESSLSKLRELYRSLFPNISFVETIQYIKRYLKYFRFNLSIAESLEFVFFLNYVKQTDIFDAILKMFDIKYKKEKERIQKKEIRVGAQEEETITERLERLGYL